MTYRVRVGSRRLYFVRSAIVAVGLMVFGATRAEVVPFLVGGLVALAGVGLNLAGARIGLDITGETVSVCNGLRTFRFPNQEVRRFRGPTADERPVDAVFMELQNGRALRVDVFSRMERNKRKPIYEELLLANRALTGQPSAGEAPPGSN